MLSRREDDEVPEAERFAFPFPPELEVRYPAVGAFVRIL